MCHPNRFLLHLPMNELCFGIKLAVNLEIEMKQITLTLHIHCLCGGYNDISAAGTATAKAVAVFNSS